MKTIRPTIHTLTILLLTFLIYSQSAFSNSCLDVYKTTNAEPPVSRELGFTTSNLPTGWKRTNNSLEESDILLMQNSYYKGSLNETGYFEIIAFDGTVLDYVMLTGMRDRVFLSDNQIVSYLNKYPRDIVKTVRVKHTHPKSFNGDNGSYKYNQFSDADLRADRGTRQTLNRYGFGDVSLESYIVYNSFWSKFSSAINRRTVAKFGYVVPH